jgi:hypothetical protein
MPLSDFLLGLAQSAEQVELRTTVAARLGLETALATELGAEGVKAIITGGREGLFTDTTNIAGHVLQLLQASESPVGKAVFEALIAGPTGVNFSAALGVDQPAIATIQKVLGFATELSLGTAAVSAALEPLLGSHGLGGAMRSVARIPEAVGLPFFMGTVLANVFETATGTPLRESIARQTRPSRLEWPQIGRLLKMHEISATDAADQLANAGFRDPDIAILQKLERQLLSVSEVEQLYELGYFDSATFQAYLDVLGFNATDKAAVVALVSHKAATTGETTVRGLARTQFKNGTLSETAYRAILKQTETPQASIDLLVSGIKLEQNVGHLHLSITEIKDLYQHAHIDGTEVRQRLAKLGLPDSDISDLLLVWADQKKVARSGIGTARILSYLVSGAIDKTTAYNHLISNGMNQSDAQFLVDHPSTHSNVASKPLEASTIVAAYKDDVLTIDAAKAKLESLKVDPTEIDLLLANATATITKGKKPRHPTKSLSETNVIDALKYGLAKGTWAERELETLGYSASDSALIVTVELTKLDPGYLAASGWQTLV